MNINKVHSQGTPNINAHEVGKKDNLSKMDSAKTILHDIKDSFIATTEDVIDNVDYKIAQLRDLFPRKSRLGSFDDVRDPHTRKLLTEHPDFVKAMDKRHENADPIVKAVYDKYEPRIKFDSLTEAGGAAYYHDTRGIRLNANEDLKNCPIPGSTFYHEVGHLIDDAMAKDVTSANRFRSASNPEYTKALHDDFENYINAYRIKNHMTREEAHAAISRDMSDPKTANDYRGVSDIYGSLSGCKVQGYWGHAKDYWQTKGSVETEAFANMFNASMSSPNELQHMKEMLPRSYGVFREMLEHDLGN